MSEIQHYINGARVSGTSGRTSPVFNPSTGAQEKTVALASVEEVDAAVAAAKAAWPEWAAWPALRRARVLDRFKNILNQRAGQLAEAITVEHGKTLEDAKGEVTRGLEVVEFATGAPQANSTTSSPRVTSPFASSSVLPCSMVIASASWPAR